MISEIVKFALKFVLVPIADWYFKKHADTEEGRRDYIAFLEIMDRKGLASVKMRLEAKNQIDRVNEMWRKEEEENAKKQI